METSKLPLYLKDWLLYRRDKCSLLCFYASTFLKSQYQNQLVEIKGKHSLAQHTAL